MSTRSMADAHRTERDSLGIVEVPGNAYFGAQTVRALANFQISHTPISQFPILIRSLAMVKLAAVRANRALGDIGVTKAEAIERACRDVMDGHCADQFPIDAFQGGAGTSTNMNMNEVIANRALENLGWRKGEYQHLHPNNDVNLSQSTNDVYPTAIRLAACFSHRQLSASLARLVAAFEQKALEFSDIVKLGRTQLQDAVPMTLGQEFQAFAVTLNEDISRLAESADLLLEVNLGGTAIGTGITADPAYADLAVAELAAISGLALRPAANLVEACWDTGAFVHFSGVMKRTAVKLSKISNDLRLLSSGPRGGLGEINLPPLQPGSSIMPGKVNPVIPEVVNQVAFQVIGADLVVTLASEAGQLQLNAMEPVIAFNLLQSASLLGNVIDTLADKCVAGITANPELCQRHLGSSTALTTGLTSLIGYERAAALANLILESGKPLKQLLLEDGKVPADIVDILLDPRAMTQPHRVRNSDTQKVRESG